MPVNWTAMINKSIDAHGVDCRLIRLADPDVPGDTDVEVTIKVGNIQFRERDKESGGELTQQNRYWKIPGARLIASPFPHPPRPGDRMIFSGDINEVTTIKNVGPSIANGQIVNWDVEVVGI